MFTRETVPRFGSLLFAYETRSGSSKEPYARDLLDRISRNQVIAVVTDDGPDNRWIEIRAPFRPPEFVRELSRELENARSETMKRLEPSINFDYAKDNPEGLAGP